MADHSLTYDPSDFDAPTWQGVHDDDTAQRIEWLAWRKGGIGASDVAALIGMSDFASPMSVWTDKLGLAGPDEDNEVMEYGRRAEPMLTGYFENRTGWTVTGQQERVEWPGNPVHRCTLDGRAMDDGTVLGVVEYKTTGYEPWTEVPDAYACQVQWQMHCDERDRAWFGVLHGRRFRTYEVARDDRAIAMLTEVADEFWERHVLAETPPPADAHRATADALSAAFPDPVEGESVDITDLRWAVDLRADAKARMSEAKFDIAKAENAIKAAIGHAEIGTIEGAPALSWKKTKRDGYVVQATEYRQLRTIGGAK